MATQKILICEDDLHIREGLVDVLESEGYEVTAAEDGLAGKDLWAPERFDLVMLDVMMPGLSGYDLCREIRQHAPEQAILMLTAKGEEIDKVIGLELGADDYLTKPFGVRELLARIHALLRRSALSSPPQQDVFRFGDADIHRKLYQAVNGTVTHKLSSRELTLIDTFLTHKNEVLTRTELLNTAWGVDYFGTTRTLDQHIAQLRKKIEPAADQPVYIQTEHGIGYRYTCPE